MTDRPIIFSAPMVRALLEGRKIMTRRLAWQDVPCRLVQPKITATDKRGKWVRCKKDHPEAQLVRKPTPWQRAAAGDRLWVKETWATAPVLDNDPPRLTGPNTPFWYTADGGAMNAVAYQPTPGKQRPSIFMPRWASRLTLPVTAVKVERLQEISEDDARAEGVRQRKIIVGSGQKIDAWFGVPQAGNDTAIGAFSDLWDSLHNPRGLCAEDAPDSWHANPEVMALTFVAHKCNIDDEQYPPRILAA